MKRIIIVEIVLAMMLVSLGGCFVDQRYVRDDAACAGMPCHRSGGNNGIVNE